MAGYNKNLFYIDRGEPEYGPHPPGQPDWYKLARGDNRYWRQLRDQEILKPKTIILPSWLLIPFGRKKQYEFIRKTISKLLLSEFKIYVWNTDKLREITEDSEYEDVVHHDSLYDIFPAIDLSAQACVELHLPRDQIHVLDYSDVCALAESKLLEDSLDLSRKSLKRINLDSLFTTFKNLENIHLDRCYGMEKKILFNTPMPALQYLDLTGTDISVKNLGAALDQTPNLNELILSHERITDEFHVSHALESLTIIHITGTSISFNALCMFLAKAPNLKTFILDKCEIRGVPQEEDFQKSLRELIKVYCKDIDQIVLTDITVVAAERLLTDSAHDPAVWKDYIPAHPKTFQFNYHGYNSLSQKMVIEKMHQWLKFYNIHPEMIPVIHGGIGYTLAKLYFTIPYKNRLFDLIKSLNEWDGKEITKEIPAGNFLHLRENILRQEKFKPLSQFLGENFHHYIEEESAISSSKKYLLTNPWHALVVEQGPATDDWVVYDPNFVDGVKRFDTLDEVIQCVKTQLGDLIGCETSDPCEPLIKSAGQFIKNGGLHALWHSANDVALLACLKNDTAQLDQLSLDGILLRDKSGRPGWLLSFDTTKVGAAFAYKLLNEFIACNSQDYIAKLEASLIGLNEKQLKDSLASLQLVFVEVGEIRNNIQKLFNSLMHRVQLQELKLQLTEDKRDFVNNDFDSSSSASVNPIVSDDRQPKFNPQQTKDRVSTPEGFQFKYKGITPNTFHQGMIIEQLLQYMTLVNKHVERIPEIKNGICYYLSNLFVTLSNTGWQLFLDLTRHWNGQLDSLDKRLVEYFNIILDDHYVVNNGFLGDNIAEFLQHDSYKPCKSKIKKYIFTNPWHAVAVQFNQTTQEWFFYDPNFIHGVKKHKSLSALVKDLKHQIGNLISIDGKQSYPLSIHSPAKFIQNGGLLTLYDDSNARRILELLPNNPQEYFNKEHLDGLLCRDNANRPAWILSLVDAPGSRYACELLKRFIELNPDNFIIQLKRSLAAMRPKQLEKYYESDALTHHEILTIYQINSIRLLFAKPMVDVVHQAQATKKTIPEDGSKEEQPKSPEIAKPINQPDQKVRPLIADIQDRVKPLAENKRQLIKFNSATNLTDFEYQLEMHCIHTSRKYFYVNSSEDLVCAENYIQTDQVTGKGILKEGPGGALYDFLISCAEDAVSPILIINYDHFKDEDLVAFNSLVDEDRQVQGIPLPENLLIMGLIDVSKPDCYQGSDFYSRFDRNETNQYASAQLKQNLNLLPVVDYIADVNNTHFIQLNHSEDWKAKLLGQWVYNEGFEFADGLLQPAIASNTSICIQNGLWKDEEFIRFWQQAYLRGYVEFNKKRILLPANFKLFKQEGYDWQHLITNLHIQSSQLNEETLPCLNPSTLSTFFKKYHCDNQTKSLSVMPGIIESMAGKELRVNLTRELNEDQWAQLLAACQKAHVRLTVHCPPTVGLPKAFGERALVPVILPELTQTMIIKTNDIDSSVASLKNGEDQWLVIDISECRSNDLLTALQGSLQNLKPTFLEEERALIQAIKNNQNVILKGKFHFQLADFLASLILQRQIAENTGSAPSAKLALVTTMDSTAFDYTKPAVHKVDNQIRFEQAKQAGFNLEELTKGHEKQFETLAEKGLTYLLAGLHAKRQSNPAKSPLLAWQGFEKLGTHHQLAPFNSATSHVDAEDFVTARKQSLMSVLDESPYAFISGATGVGKSTFVEKYLSTYSEDEILAWINDASDALKILFIDEANIGKKDWSQFEGLFQVPPHILIEGEVRHLSNKHKVIFAGNPCSYGDRHLASLFERHGNAVLFEPMPLVYIYEAILKPILKEQGEKTLAITQSILDAYRFICERTTTEVLITPRELEMMALLIVSHLANKPEDDVLAVARHYVYQIGRPLLTNKEFQVAFDGEFKPAFALNSLKPTPVNGLKEFLVTTSREPLVHQLHELLTLQQFKAHTQNNAQCYGGLGGIVIEGDPGIGKSELVIDILRQQGYCENKASSIDTTKTFYRLPASLSIAEKKKILLKAFDEGAIVIMDEINSSPMMERFLNALLMQQRPQEYRNKLIEKGYTKEAAMRALKPGFLIIGTQNPMTMAGRRATSTALARRLIKSNLPPYTRDEMLSILQNKGLDGARAAQLIAKYNEKCNNAKKHPKLVAPCFRDLLKNADRLIKSNPLMIKAVAIKPVVASVIIAKPIVQMKAAVHSEAQSSHAKINGVLGMSPVVRKRLTICPIPQTGANCKTTAIAMIDLYYAQSLSQDANEKLNYPAIPVHKSADPQAPVSMREIAKTFGSRQGELLEVTQMTKMINHIALEAELKDFSDKNQIDAFRKTIAECINENNPLIVFFPVDDDGDVEDYDEDTLNEHAGVIYGYDLAKDEVEVLHWGKSYTYKMSELYHKSLTLPEERDREIYIQVKKENPLRQANPTRKWDMLTQRDDNSKAAGIDRNLIRESIIPNPKSGFKGKLIAFKTPSLEKLLARGQRSISSKAAAAASTPAIQSINPSIRSTK